MNKNSTYLQEFFVEKLFLVLKFLFPEIKFIKLTKKGNVIFKAPNNVFTKRITLDTLLYNSIPYGLAISFWGNPEQKRIYLKKVSEIVSDFVSETNNIESIISYYYTLCYKYDDKEVILINRDTTINSNKKDLEECIIGNQEPLNIIDYLFEGWKKRIKSTKPSKKKFKKLFLNLRIYHFFLTELLLYFNNSYHTKQNKILKNILSRDPPETKIILCNGP